MIAVSLVDKSNDESITDKFLTFIWIPHRRTQQLAKVIHNADIKLRYR